MFVAKYQSAQMRSGLLQKDNHSLVDGFGIWERRSVDFQDRRASHLSRYIFKNSIGEGTDTFIVVDPDFDRWKVDATKPLARRIVKTG